MAFTARITRLVLGCAIVIALGAKNGTSAFYLPTDYHDHDAVPIRVNSMHSNMKPSMPMEFYDFPFCRPPIIERAPQNLGELLQGEDVETSPFPDLVFLRQVDNAVLCDKYYNDTQWKHIHKLVREGYRVRLLIDNLPNIQVTEYTISRLNPELPPRVIHTTYQGYFLGEEDSGLPYTHVDFRIKYHVSHVELKNDKEHANANANATFYRIVGVETTPSRPTGPEIGKPLIWTYSVHWEESEISWASRFDIVMKSNTVTAAHKAARISYLVACIVVILMSSVFLVYIYARSVRQASSLDGLSSDGPGWKAMAPYVFRRPKHHAELFIATVATGAHLAVALVVNAVIGMFGLLYVNHRGALIESALISYVMLASVAGYCAARLADTMELSRRRWRIFALTYVLYPAIAVSILFVVNAFLAAQKSTASVRPWVALLIFGVGAAVSFLCMLVGFIVGVKQGPFEVPVKPVNGRETIPALSDADVPQSHMLSNEYLDDYFYRLQSMRALFSLFSFGIIVAMLTMIYQAIWASRMYTLFSVLAAAVTAWYLATSALSIVFIYHQLNWENPDWWWSSFWMGAFSALWVFLFSCFYYLGSLIYTPASVVVYFLQITLISVTLAFIMGTVSFVAAAALVWRAYNTMKIN